MTASGWNSAITNPPPEGVVVEVANNGGVHPLLLTRSHPSTTVSTMTDLPDDDELTMTRCEQFGHIDERIVDEDDIGVTYNCGACGAEWWEDYDEG